MHHVWALLGTPHSFLGIAHYTCTSSGIIRGIPTLLIIIVIIGESSEDFNVCDHAGVFTNRAAVMLLLIFLNPISTSVSVFRV